MPKGRGNDVSPYLLDSMAIGPHWDVDLGLRWDRFKSSFSEPISGTGFDRTDTFISPRAAVIFKPDGTQSYYLSYGTSYNPAIEYLIIAPSDNSLSPEKNSTVELGAKIKLLNGRIELTGALFDTRVKNVRISDPDDPTVQEAPFDQEVKGVELGASGYLTDIWEITANYSHLNDKITANSTDPLSVGKFAPNTPHDAANVWTHGRTRLGLGCGRRIYRGQSSICRHGKHGGRAAICGVQRDGVLQDQRALQAAIEPQQRHRQAVLHRHLLHRRPGKSRTAQRRPHTHRHRHLPLLIEETRRGCRIDRQAPRPDGIAATEGPVWAGS